MNRKNKGSAFWVTTRTSFYIFFGIIYLGFIWLLHQYAPLYQKRNDLWNDRTFSEPLEGELFPDNIILIDIDSWPYYKDNRDEAKQARDKVVTEITVIIDLLNKNPREKPPFIGIDMTFESFANKKIMEQLFTRIKNNKNIFPAVEFDREKRVLKFPRNYFWNRIREDLEKIKKRFMVINLEKYAGEPVRRYKTFYNAAFDDTGAVFNFPSMGMVIAKMVKKYYLGDNSTFEVPDRVSRLRFRYLIQNIKEDYEKYNIFSLQRAKELLAKPGGTLDISRNIVIFGRADPNPDGRDRFPICASVKKGNLERGATLPGVLIHINAAQSILLGENIHGIGAWKLLVYLIILLAVLIPLHIFIEAVVAKWKSGMSHWYSEIFLFFAFVFLIIFLDNLLKEPGSHNLEVPMFTFYMFVLKFYPVLGVYNWIYRRVVSRVTKEELKNAK